MISFLAGLFIRDYRNYSDPEVRRKYGSLCAIVAIVLNILLSSAKLVMSHVSGSFSMRADALNNLTDAGSSILLLLAFYFAGMKPQPDRPFGHGRIEYVAALMVAMFVILFGVELGRDSVEHIFHPHVLSFSGIAVAVLVQSVAVKCYMSFFMISISKKIHSEALKATGLDSLSDTLSTFMAMAALLIFRFTPNHLNIDAWFGLGVSLIILKTGLESAWATIKQLLGTKPDKSLIDEIKKICMKYDEVIGIHDIVVHDYGPGRLHISVHCEVSGDGNIYHLHDAMDRIMREMDEKLNCESVVHMDPVCTDDERVTEMREKLEQAVKAYGKDVHIHDFRIVDGPSHVNLIFDCVVPFDVESDTKKAEEEIRKIACGLWPNSFAVIKIDRPYV